MESNINALHREPWNKGKIVGQNARFPWSLTVQQRQPARPARRGSARRLFSFVQQSNGYGGSEFGCNGDICRGPVGLLRADLKVLLEAGFAARSTRGVLAMF